MTSHDAHAEKEELDTEVSSGLHTADGNAKGEPLSSPPKSPLSDEDDPEPREAGDEVLRTVTGLKVSISASQGIRCILG